MAPAPLPHAPKKPLPPSPAIPLPAPAPQIQPAEPDADVAAEKTPKQAADAPQKPALVAKAAPQTVAPPAASAAPDPMPQSPPVSVASVMPAPLPPVSPADGDASSLFFVTGTPDPAAKSPVPAGAHLEDGDYVSSRHSFMWGDLRIKIFVRGGVITGVQALQFPDHRSQSLYLSGLALPTLESEVIKKQTSQVDTVSSATDTSYVFQDAVADAIVKATRG